MGPITMTFLVIGGVGTVVLAVALLIGDLLNIGHVDADGPFSVPAVAGFVGSFGFAGALVAELVGTGTPALVAASATGLAAAVPTAWLAVRLSRAAMRMNTDATPTSADLVGACGVVVTRIPVQGYGEVRVSLGGQPVKLNARADRP
ncbi:MAG TPA: hypothetical protein VF657_11455, partial [Actinoplanes sp.]